MFVTGIGVVKIEMLSSGIRIASRGTRVSGEDAYNALVICLACYI